MENLKIKVNSEAESKEAQELFFELGYGWNSCGKNYTHVGWFYDFITAYPCNKRLAMGSGVDAEKEITLAELRDMVVLKRKPMKEYLNPNQNYELVLCAEKDKDEGFIEVPEGAMFAWKLENGGVFFTGLEMGYRDASAVWHRHIQPEELPFIDDEPKIETATGYQLDVIGSNTYGARSRNKGETCDSYRDYLIRFKNLNPSLNDQYMEQDNVNHPNHYTQGKVECIDALESATIGKSGIEAVCVANVIKYLWRYEQKNGLEDVKKAQFYLNRLVVTLENNNG